MVVQFEEGIAIGNGAAEANLSEFDRTGSKYGAYKLERVFPFLDYVNSTPRIARNLSALRHTYYVHYGARADPETDLWRVCLECGGGVCQTRADQPFP